MNTGDYVMPFGKYKGMTLDEIGDDDAGIKYLDWMRGVRDEGDDVGEAIDEYLEDPVRRHRVNSVLG